MKIVKSFEEFVDEGIAKKVSVDTQRAKNLILESKRRLSFVRETIQKMGIDNDKASIYVEYCYNVIMPLIRAKMLERGYTSTGQGAHEAEVAFSREIEFTQAEIDTLDQLRYFRNGIVYYGKRLDKNYAEKIIAFTISISKKLLK